MYICVYIWPRRKNEKIYTKMLVKILGKEELQAFLFFVSQLYTIVYTFLKGRHGRRRVFYSQLKNDVQLESCEVSFIWGKMRTAAQEAASQTALRVLQSGSGGESVYKVLGKGEFHTMKIYFIKSLLLVMRT